VAQCVERLEGIVDQVASIIDPSHPIQDLIIIPDRFQPYSIHARIGAEKTVGTKVDELSPKRDSFCHAANGVTSFEYGDVKTALRELVCRG
jgi:hypothetical protein